MKFVLNKKKSVTFILISLCFSLIFVQCYIKSSSLSTINDIDDIFIRRITDDLLGSVSTFRDGIIIKGNSIVADTKNNSFITGTINQDLGFNFDYFIGKINSTGNLIWYETINNQIIDKSYDIAISKNQIFGYIVGETTNNTNDNSECFLSCFNLSNGAELWNMTFHKSMHSIGGYSLVIYNESIFVAGIEKAIFPQYTVNYVFLACINATDHTLLWMNTCSTGPYDSQPMLELNVQDNELILVYNKNENGNQNYQFSIQRYDFYGNITDSFTSNTSCYPKINDFVIINSNSILLAGDCFENTGTTYRDIYVAKFDLTSETLEEFIIGNENQDEIANGVIYYDSTDIFVAGYLDSQVTKKYAAFLLNLQLDGILNWFRESAGFYISALNDIVEISNHQIIVIGTAQYNYDFFYERLLFSITSDNDRDSLSDYWEPTIGTDPNKFDTDGDGYSDAEEHFASTDPLNARSFPKRRRSIVNFGISLFIILTVGFFGFQLYTTIDQRRSVPRDKKSLAQKIIDFIREKTKKNE